MRLFISINFSNGIISRLLQIQGKIREQAIKGNFSRPENLHLTLAFIGETPASLIPAILQAIEKTLKVSGTGEFTLDFNHSGCFRHSNKELWWIGADKNCRGLASLQNLRQRLAAELSASGIAFDKRPFNAHITLGREIKFSSPIELPVEKLTVPVQRISLMNSEHINGKLTYTEIFGYDLKDIAIVPSG
jgi:2'-5' RNA ligase